MVSKAEQVRTHSHSLFRQMWKGMLDKQSSRFLMILSPRVSDLLLLMATVDD